jgi:hypothetical protein
MSRHDKSAGGGDLPRAQFDFGQGENKRMSALMKVKIKKC